MVFIQSPSHEYQQPHQQKPRGPGRAEGACFFSVSTLHFLCAGKAVCEQENTIAMSCSVFLWQLFLLLRVFVSMILHCAAVSTSEREIKQDIVQKWQLLDTEEELAMGLHSCSQLELSKHSRIPLIMHRRNGNSGQNSGNVCSQSSFGSTKMTYLKVICLWGHLCHLVACVTDWKQINKPRHIQERRAAGCFYQSGIALQGYHSEQHPKYYR